MIATKQDHDDALDLICSGVVPEYYQDDLQRICASYGCNEHEPAEEFAIFRRVRDTRLMNPHTGTIQTLIDWLSDFHNTAPELWGGPNFMDAELIEVEP